MRLAVEATIDPYDRAWNPTEEPAGFDMFDVDDEAVSGV